MRAENEIENDELHSVQLLQLQMHLDHGSKPYLPMAGIPGAAEHNISKRLSKQAFVALMQNETSKQLSRQPSDSKPQLQPALVQNSQIAQSPGQLQHNVDLLQLSKAAYKAMSFSRAASGVFAIMVLLVLLIGLVSFAAVMEARRRSAARQQRFRRTSPPSTDEQMKDPSMMRSAVGYATPTTSASTMAMQDGTAKAPIMKSRQPEASSLSGGTPTSGSTLDRAYQMLMTQGAGMPQGPRLVDRPFSEKPSTPLIRSGNSANAMSMTMTQEIPPATGLMAPDGSPVGSSLAVTGDVTKEPTPRPSMGVSSQSVFRDVDKVLSAPGMPPPMGEQFVLSSGGLSFSTTLEKFSEMALSGKPVALMGLSGYPLFHAMLAGGPGEHSSLELALSRDADAPRAVIKPLARGSLQERPSVLIGCEGEMYGEIRAVGSQIYSVHHEDKEVMVMKMGVAPELLRVCLPSASGGTTIATAKFQKSGVESSRLSFEVSGGADPVLVSTCMIGLLLSAVDWSTM